MAYATLNQIKFVSCCIKMDMQRQKAVSDPEPKYDLFRAGLDSIGGAGLDIHARNAHQSGKISVGGGRTSMCWRHIGQVPCCNRTPVTTLIYGHDTVPAVS